MAFRFPKHTVMKKLAMAVCGFCGQGDRAFYIRGASGAIICGECIDAVAERTAKDRAAMRVEARERLRNEEGLAASLRKGKVSSE